jgi:hypothetical protein
VVNAVPKGNYFLLGGAATDNNAKVFRDGQLKVLQPLVAKGDIKIVGQQWTPEWDPTNALKITENALTANHNNIQAIVASNDGTAGGAIAALAAQKLAGKVAVSGQDADLAGDETRYLGHPDHDGIQAAEQPRHAGRTAVGRSGSGHRAQIHRQDEQRHQGRQHRSADANPADQAECRPRGEGRFLHACAGRTVS